MRTPDDMARPSPRNLRRILRAAWSRHWFLGLTTSAMLAAPGLARAAQFKAAPGLPEESDPGEGMILGLIHENTLFFISLGVFAAFWFLFGGGRRAKIGRKGH